MKGRGARTAAFALGMGLLLVSTIVDAQWVLVARRAIGSVEQMSQAAPGGGTTTTPRP